MVFSRVKPPGWALNELLTSAQANALDINMTRALDGLDGGNYTLSTILRLAGAGLGISGVFDSEGFGPVFGLQNWEGSFDNFPTANLVPRGMSYGPGRRVWIAVGQSDSCDMISLTSHPVADFEGKL